MPKDEFDFDDPMELSGVALFTEEDTTGAMCECFIEEFMRMGYDAGQILALFRSPNYLGPNMVLQQRGERYIRDQIATVLACWGRGVSAPGADAGEDAVAPASALRDSRSPQRGEGRGEGCDRPRPSPRPAGLRLLTPALSSIEEERERGRGALRDRADTPPPLDPQRTPPTLVNAPP